MNFIIKNNALKTLIINIFYWKSIIFIVFIFLLKNHNFNIYKIIINKVYNRILIL
jgi:hypothetical protein